MPVMFPAFVLPLLFGLLDVGDVNGAFSKYTWGMRNLRPRDNPGGFILVRARRYLLVPIVMAATVAVCYYTDIILFEATPRTHLWAALIAFLFSRRPISITINESYLYFMSFLQHGLSNMFNTFLGGR
jgi:hypothetical protein